MQQSILHSPCRACQGTRQGSRHAATRVIEHAAISRSKVTVHARRTKQATDQLVTVSENGYSNGSQKQMKDKILADTIKSIVAKHGSNAIMSLDSKPLPIETTPSGCLTLDRAMGGGYPKGRIIEIYGPESSGKTTLAMHAIAEVQKLGGNACLIDAENAFDVVYAERLGIDLKSLYIVQPDYGEQAFSIADELARSGAMDVIVVDSVSALVPRSEIEGDYGVAQVGAQARLMSQALRKLAGNVARTKCTIIFINQIRMKVGVLYGNPETTSGGQALKFYSSIRLDIRAKDKITEPGKPDPVGNRVKVRVMKNKIASPFGVAEFDIMYGKGINALGCVLDAAEVTEVVERKGSYYYYNGTRIAQGREKAQQHLKDNPDLLQEIELKVRQQLSNFAGPITVGKGSAAEDDLEEADDALEGGEAEEDLLAELERQL